MPAFLRNSVMPATQTTVWDTSMKWPKMSFIQKIVFLGKFLISLITFGFVFPHVLH